MAGRGLVLETPDGEIDVRRPFRPVRFAGETPIVSRLEAGPVEVVNLIGDRRRVRIDLAVLEAGRTQRLGPGLHIAYCPAGPARLRLQGEDYALPADGGLRIEDADGLGRDLHRRPDRDGERGMRIAVVGAGGVGGAYGAALAKAGADVTFIARGAHLAAMKSKGLKVESPRGDTHLVPTQATDDPKTVGPVDVVLFCVKLWDVESAGAAIKPMVGADTAVIPLQNGVDASDRLAPILGRQAVMGGVANISATIAEPGVIRQTGTVMRMVFGELDGKKSARAEAFAAMCAKAGIDGVLSPAILTELWMKFILLASNASIMALDPPARRQAARRSRHRAVVHHRLRGGGRGRPRRGRRLAGRCRRQDAELQPQRAAPPHALDGRRPAARQSDRVAVAFRQGGRARQEARRADADARFHVCRPEALHHGQALPRRGPCASS